MDFELPLLSGSDEIREAFKAMIEQSVSGIVAETSSGHRLLHYSQVLAASEAGIQYILDIPSYLPLDPSSTQSEYSLNSVAFMKAIVQSRRQPGAVPFMAQSPGYCCDGQVRHFYPPHKRGPTDDCTALGCSGKLP
jgi:hypothetical protein